MDKSFPYNTGLHHTRFTSIIEKHKETRYERLRCSRARALAISNSAVRAKLCAPNRANAILPLSLSLSLSLFLSLSLSLFSLSPRCPGGGSGQRFARFAVNPAEQTSRKLPAIAARIARRSLSYPSVQQCASFTRSKHHEVAPVWFRNRLMPRGANIFHEAGFTI